MESVGLYTSRSESEDVKQYVSGVITVLRKSEMHSMKSRNEKSDNSSDNCSTSPQKPLFLLVKFDLLVYSQTGIIQGFES